MGWRATPRCAGELRVDRTFEDVYVEFWPRLYRYVWLLVRHHEDAEDIAGEAIRRALGAWNDGRGPRGEPLPWLFLIARRVVIERHRRRRIVALSFTSVAEPAGPDDRLQGCESAVWFDQLRDSLTQRQHEAVLLRYLYGLGDDQIAQVMGLSQAGVRTNVSRALAALRQRPEVLS
jgi:RNA polymerase sigma factor (sigma-70 family)